MLLLFCSLTVLLLSFFFGNAVIVIYLYVCGIAELDNVKAAVGQVDLQGRLVPVHATETGQAFRSWQRYPLRKRNRCWCIMTPFGAKGARRRWRRTLVTLCRTWCTGRRRERPFAARRGTIATGGGHS